MKPVDQEFTHDPEAGINGDCKRAVIASLLGLPISAVPHFLDGLTTDADASGLEFDRRVQSFLAPRGFVEVELRDMEATLRWIRQRLGGGNVYHEIYGPSPRGAGLLHSVVGCNGNVVHDPHPSKAGLAGDPSEWHHIFLLASCAAPASAQLDADLPPLPEDRYSLWLQHGKVVNCFTHGVGDPAVWDHDKHWENKGYSRAPLYTTEQYRQGQLEIVAQYAERIRLLTEELENWKKSSGLLSESRDRWKASAKRCEQPAQSIGDDPEFERLRAAYVKALNGNLKTYAAAKSALIAYIDGRTASTADWRSIPPPVGCAFYAYHPSLIHPDYNPWGVVEAVHDGEKFIGAVWNGVHDGWDTTEIEVELWKPINGPNNDQIARSKGAKR